VCGCGHSGGIESQRGSRRDTKGGWHGRFATRASPQLSGKSSTLFSGNLLEALRGFYLRSLIEQPRQQNNTYSSNHPRLAV
jgi:hypothetical protein